MIDEHVRRSKRGVRTAWNVLGVVLGISISSAAAAEPSPIPERLLPLARELELQFHLSYDATPPAYRERIQYTLGVFGAWQRSGRTPRDEALLEGWLHDAVNRSLPDRRARLAPVPAFSNPSSVASTDSTPEMPPHEPIREGGTAAAPREPEMARSPSPPLTASAPPAERVPAYDPIARPAPPTVLAPARRPPEPPTAAIPPAETQALAPSRSAARSPSTRNELQPPQALGSHQPPPTRSSNVRQQTTAPPIEVAATGMADEPRSADGSTFHRGPLHGEPPAGRPPSGSSLPPTPSDLNLEEYAARLAGHRLGIRRLEARLLELEAPTAQQLATLVGELETLHHQGSLLALYARLLPEDWKSSYGGPISTADAMRMLADLIKRSQSSLAEQPDRETSHDRESALLTTLATKLVQLTEALEQLPSD